MSALLDLPHEIVEDILRIVVGSAVGVEPNNSDGVPEEGPIKHADAVEGVMLLLKLDGMVRRCMRGDARLSDGSSEAELRPVPGHRGLFASYDC